MKIFLIGVTFPICFLLVNGGRETTSNFQINGLNVLVKTDGNICSICVQDKCITQECSANERKCLQGICTECSESICTTQSDDRTGIIYRVDLNTGSITLSDNSPVPMISNRNNAPNVDVSAMQTNKLRSNLTKPTDRSNINNFNRNDRSSNISGNNSHTSRGTTLSASSKKRFKIEGYSYTIQCWQDKKECKTCLVDNNLWCKTQNAFSARRVCMYSVCTTCSNGVCIVHSINNKCDPKDEDLVCENPTKIVMTRIDLNKSEIKQCNERGAYSYYSPQGVYTDNGKGKKVHASGDGLFRTSDNGDFSYATSKGIFKRDENGNIQISNSKGTFQQDTEGNIAISNPTGIYQQDISGKVNMASRGNSYDSRGNKNIEDGVIKEYDGKGGYKEIGVNSIKKVKPNGDTKTVKPDGTIIKKKANGDTKTIADGSTMIVMANGDTEVTRADGSKKIKKANGDSEITRADGSKTIKKANGDTVIIGADGSKKIVMANSGTDRSKTIKKANVDSMAIGAGSKTIKKANSDNVIIGTDASKNDNRSRWRI